MVRFLVFLFGIIPALLFVVYVSTVLYYQLKFLPIDNRIEELCLEQGGPTIHEKIILTAEEFENYGPILGSLPIPSERASENSQIPYFYRRTTFGIDEIGGNTSSLSSKNKSIIQRSEYRIIRKLDQHEMGVSISFLRVSANTWVGLPTGGFGCTSIEGFSLNLQPEILDVRSLY